MYTDNEFLDELWKRDSEEFINHLEEIYIDMNK